MAHPGGIRRQPLWAACLKRAADQDRTGIISLEDRFRGSALIAIFAISPAQPQNSLSVCDRWLPPILVALWSVCGLRVRRRFDRVPKFASSRRPLPRTGAPLARRRWRLPSRGDRNDRHGSYDGLPTLLHRACRSIGRVTANHRGMANRDEVLWRPAQAGREDGRSPLTWAASRSV
jgi:hypothetical protein